MSIGLNAEIPISNHFRFQNKPWVRTQRAIDLHGHFGNFFPPRGSVRLREINAFECDFWRD